MEKISDVLLKLFSFGIVICLFAGGASFLAYLVGLIIGGEVATALCLFVFERYLPWVIKFSSIFIGFGLLGMYFSNQKALTVKNDKK